MINVLMVVVLRTPHAAVSRFHCRCRCPLSPHSLEMQNADFFPRPYNVSTRILPFAIIIIYLYAVMAMNHLHSVQSVRMVKVMMGCRLSTLIHNEDGREKERQREKSSRVPARLSYLCFYSPPGSSDGNHRNDIISNVKQLSCK